MRPRVLHLVAPLVLAVVGLGPRAAAAEEAKPDFAAAKKYFKSGQSLLQSERYGEAIVEFKKAYDITKDGLVMGQIAQAYAKAGDFESALTAIRVYREALPEGERASADTLIKDYEKAIKEGRSKKLVLPGEEPPKVEEPKKEEAAPPPPPEEKPAKKRRLYTWIAAGAAGALALSALVVGLNAQSRFDELADTCKPTCKDSEVDSVKTRALVADVLWGTAAAAAVTAAVLFFVEGRGGGEKKEPGEGGEEESVSRRLQLSPLVGRGYGVNAGLRF
jgi:tetratricopeptide (TPR) repeat protein